MTTLPSPVKTPPPTATHPADGHITDSVSTEPFMTKDLATTSTLLLRSFDRSTCVAVPVSRACTAVPRFRGSLRADLADRGLGFDC